VGRADTRSIGKVHQFRDADKRRTGASRTGESICPKQGVQPLLRFRIRKQPLLAQAKDGIRPGQVHGEPLIDCRILMDCIMVTRMTENGVSTCRAAGTEQFEKFQTGFGRRKRTLVQYDYRASDGELFSCVAPTLEECRRRRDAWLSEKERKEAQR